MRKCFHFLWVSFTAGFLKHSMAILEEPFLVGGWLCEQGHLTAPQHLFGRCQSCPPTYENKNTSWGWEENLPWQKPSRIYQLPNVSTHSCDQVLSSVAQFSTFSPNTDDRWHTRQSLDSQVRWAEQKWFVTFDLSSPGVVKGTAQTARIFSPSTVLSVDSGCSTFWFWWTMLFMNMSI